MAVFTNFATLSYNGGTTNSNTVTGELLETLSATKSAVMDDYTAKDDVTYVITLLNSGATPLTGLTVTDTGVVNDANPSSSDAILAQSQTLVSTAEQLNTAN